MRCGPTPRPTACRSRSPTAATTTGPTSSPRRSSRSSRARALDDRPLPLYASRPQNRREWLHVDDHCRAIDAVLQPGPGGETYNVGSGVEASIEEIADAVLAATGQAAVAQGDRAGPPEPRPPLPARLLQDPPRAGLGALVAVRAGPGRHRRLVRRPPRLVGAAAGPGPGRRGRLGHGRPRRREPPLRILVTGANGQLGRDLRDVLAGRGARRRAPDAARCSAPTGRARASTTRCWPPTSTPCDLDDRDAVLDAVRAASGPSWCSTAGPTRRSTPARPTSTRPSRSTPWAPATWPRRPRRSAPTWSTCPPTTSSTARRAAPTRVGPPRPDARSTARSKLAGEQECAVPAPTIVRTAWVCGAHGANMVKTVLRLADGATGTLRFVDDQHGCPTFTADLAPAVVRLGARPPPGHLPRDQPGGDHLVRASSGRCWPRPAHDPERVEPITTADLDPPRPAPRPANSGLDNSRSAPERAARLLPGLAGRPAAGWSAAAPVGGGPA